jgi:hypothetical protein
MHARMHANTNDDDHDDDGSDGDDVHGPGQSQRFHRGVDLGRGVQLEVFRWQAGRQAGRQGRRRQASSRTDKEHTPSLRFVSQSSEC